MAEIARHLRPADREIVELALRETDPGEARRFEPISRGPLFALIAIPVVVVLALPSCLLRLLRGWLSRDADRAG